MLAKSKIFSTPEEIKTPDIILLADAASAAVDLSLSAAISGREGVIAAVVDPYINGVHVSLLESSENCAPPDLISKWLSEGVTALDKKDMAEVMYCQQAMLTMHRSVWSLPFEKMHNSWSRAVESYRMRLDDFISVD